MAKIAPKGKKVTGTKKKDKITWVSSKLWKKNLTVKAGAGNDVINFKKSKYKNKLYGEAGNDKIYGGKGADKIWGGKGKDIINAGKGTNTIYHSKGDGNDTIAKGGGTDTLVIKGEKSINSLIGYASGNNVIIKRPNGEKITLKDYLKGGHSVKYIQVGDKKVRTEEIRNLISSAAQTVNGTVWGDNIYTTGVNARVYAGAGNDIIHITLDSDNPELYLGKGNDIVSLDADDRIVNIHFEGADGKNILTGLSNPNIKSAAVSFYSSDMFNKVYSPNGQVLFEYVIADKSGNDMVIQVANSTFTIKDAYSKYTYYDQYEGLYVEKTCGNKLMGYYCDPITGYDGDLRRVFYESDKIQTIVSDADEYPDEIFDMPVGMRNNLIFSTFSSGDNANIDTRMISVNGQRNSIVAISNAVNQNIIVLSTANKVYSATSNGGTNTISVAEGGTQISVAEGNHVISLTGENSSANIAVGDATVGSGKTVNIHGAGDAINGMQYIFAGIDDYDNYYAPMFSHYYNANANNSINGDDYISVVVAKKESEEAAGYTEFIPQDIKIWGTWSEGSFNLDTEHFGNNELHVNGEGGCFKELTQFVDMGVANNALVINSNGGVLDIAKSVYIKSTGNSSDTYTCNTSTVGKQVIINDGDGSDSLTISENAKAESFRFFFDVDKTGKILGTDLYVMSMSNGEGEGDGASYTNSSLNQYIVGKDMSVDYLKIENFFDGNGGHGTGYIETIKANDNKTCNIDACINAVKADVVTWLEASHGGVYYDSVMQAISENANTNTLVGQYTTEFSSSNIKWDNYWT